MNNLVRISILFTSLFGCVPASTHQELSENFDSLENEYNVLKSQHEALEMEYNNMAPVVLLEEGKAFMNSWKWFDATQKFTQVINKFPQTKQATEASELMEKVNKEVDSRGKYSYRINEKAYVEVQQNAKREQPLAFGNISDWKDSTNEEKIRVCVGFTDEFNKRSSVKITSIDLYNCIEVATKDLDVTNSITVQNMVIMCMDEMLKN